MSQFKPAMIRPLTGVRGLAALAVVLYHLPSMGLNGQALYGAVAPWIDTGWMGVDLFFILSGFVLSLVHQQDFARVVTRTEVVRFWQLRFARVYPLHFVILLAYGSIIGLQTLLIKPIDYPGLTPLEFTGALGLLQIWLPVHSAFNAPSWSISAEALAYLAFPVIAWLTARCRPFWVTAGLIMALLAILSAWPWGHWVFFWQISPGTPVHSLDAVIRIIGEFSLGCLLYNAVRVYTLPGWQSDGIALLLTGLLPWALKGGLPWVLPLFMGLIACLAQPGPWLNRLLGNARMVYFGEISYALYLCHMLVLMLVAPVFRRLPVDPWVQWAAALPYLLGVIGLAHLLYQHVETPARQWLRQQFKAKRQATQPA